jgi:death-on-curing protein
VAAPIVYLTLDDALYIHADQIDSYGGATGVRDQGLVLSALLRPQTGYYPDLIAEAAALWESLTMNHGFVDGNKRVAYACMIVFMAMNGLGIDASQEEAIELIYANIEGGTFRHAVLDQWLRGRAVTYASP